MIVSGQMSVKKVPMSMLAPQGNSLLFTGLSNGIVKKFDMRKKGNVKALEISENPIIGIVSGDKSITAIDKEGVITEIDIRSYSAIRITKTKAQVNVFNIIRPNYLLIGTQKEFEVLDVSNKMNIVYKSELHKGPVRSIYYSTSDKLLFTGGYDKNINMFQYSS